MAFLSAIVFILYIANLSRMLQIALIRARGEFDLVQKPALLSQALALIKRSISFTRAALMPGSDKAWPARPTSVNEEHAQAR